MNSESVDLGLSSRYATCNLGASSPEVSGDYYAWGELKPKIIFDKDKYQFFAKRDYKYGKDGDCAKYDPNIKTILDPVDDVVNVRLGGSWHIPSFHDIVELYENCSWKWETQKGVTGYRLTSKINGYTDRSIFLPAAGIILGNKTINKGYAGYYWCSSLCQQNANKALSSVFDRNIIIRCLPNVRYAGLCIRPVCD